MSNYGPPPGSPQDPYGQQPQNPYGQPQQPFGAPPGLNGEQTKGFFGALFDFSFTHFVTPMVVKVLYILGTIAIGLAYIVIVIAAFTNSAGGGILALIAGAIVAIIYLALFRITLEFYVSVVRMSEDIHKRLPKG